MQVQVTKKHIEKAEQIRKKMNKDEFKCYDGSVFCPIALAVKEKMHKPVSVSEETLEIYMNGVTHYYDLPTSATNFINRFDDEKSVKPIKFNVTPYW